MNWLDGVELIAGLVIVVAAALLVRVFERRNAGRAPSGFGMALVPVSFLTVFVLGALLILTGVGLF
jgi:hypothetical protein